MDAIKMVGIVKCFGPVRANDGIDFTVKHQEIHCLLGENGTGKSTLMNILFGLYHPDAGEIFINEKFYCVIGIIHQSKRCHTSLFYSQIFFQTFFGSKA